MDDYKGGRDETPADLPPQFEMIREVLHALAIPVVEAEGFEADDVLATLASEARDRGHPVIIVTGDRDSYQLVEDPYIRVLYNRRGVSDYALYDEAGIEERTGVLPPKYPLLAALRGDPSDNLPGVPGVGEKTAAKLINEYGDLDTLYAHLDALSPKLRQNLAEHVDRVRMNAEVIPLVRDVPLDVHVDDLVLGGWDLEEARAAFAALEMKGAWTRFESAMRDGLLGAPGAGGYGGGSGAWSTEDGGASPEAAPVGPEDGPDWLATPACAVPTDVDRACSDLEDLFAAVRSATGNVALAASWEGDAGRTPLLALALVAEAGGRRRTTDPGGVPRPVRGRASRGRAAGAGRPGLGARSGRGGRGGPRRQGADADPPARSASTSPAWPWTPRWPPTCSTRRTTATGSPTSHRATSRCPSTTEPGPRARGPSSSRRPATRTTAPPARDSTTPAWVWCAWPPCSPGCVCRCRRPSAEIGEGALFEDMERPLVRVLARMEVVGIPVDREVLRSIAVGLTAECESLESTMHELAGSPFNVNSVKQLRTVLYDDLGLQPGRKTKTGYSTDARTLESLRGQHPIIEVLLRYREVEKLRSTYGETLAAEVAPDGRIHATFRQTVARTGRLSSDRPNLHNIPVRTDEGRRFREAFVPSAGRRLLVADYDQVELRAIAHLSGDPGLTSAFAAGEDIHRTVAARVFGVDRDAVTHEQRSTAKMVSYGLAYGMESYGLAQRLGVPVEEAKGILDAFFGAFPSVQAYMERAVAEARANGYTVTSFGRRRPLPDLLSSNHQVRQAAERQAMNAGIQGLAADLFKMALIRLDSGLEEGGYRSDLVLQVHDEVLVDVEPDESDAVEQLTLAALTGAADLDVPLKVAMAWGSSWAEAKG